MWRVILCVIGLCVSAVAGAQCVNMYGTVTDAYSGKPIEGVLISQKMKGKIQPLSRTSAAGAYQLSLPCAAEGVRLEATGYRSQSLPVHRVGAQEGGVFLVPVKMVPVDRQGRDKPYFQEQQQFVSLPAAGESAMRATRIFEISDALTGKVLPADLCLIYTKSGKRDCRKLSGLYEVDFTDTDIIAIEVKAGGYQDYFGNLILDELDNKKSKYQIRLSAQPNLLSVTVNAKEEHVSCLISGNAPERMTSTDGVHFFAEIRSGGSYRLTVRAKSGTILHSKEINTEAGANLYAVDVPKGNGAVKEAMQPNLPVATIETVPRTIYFDRSDYKLRAESKPVLDTLASWLRQNPSGYLSITGHTDNVGNSTLNQTLSEYRARLAYHFLEQRGADVSRVTYNGKGDAYPAAPNDIEANREKNRRVEIKLINRP